MYHRTPTHGLRACAMAMLALAAPSLTAAPYVYVAHNPTNDVSVYDGATRTLVTRIPVGSTPFPIAISPDGSRVLVGNGGSNTVSVIESGGHTVIATVPVGANPYGIAINPSGTRAYVGNYASDDVTVIDLATYTAIATIPVGGHVGTVAVHPNGSKAYVSVGSTNSMKVIDTATNTVTATIANSGISPWGIVFSKDGGTRAFVANYSGANVSVINTATDTVTAQWPVGNQPVGVALNGDGSRLYVANSGSDTLSIVDTTAGFLLNNLPVGRRPFGVAADPDGRMMWVENAGDFSGNGSISYVDGAANVVVASIPTGLYASAIGNFVSPYMPPSAPTNVSAAPGVSKVTLSFTAPLSDGGKPVTSYTATCGAQTRTGTASPIVVDQLANGTTVACSVYATNSVGNGTPSSPVNATPANVPGAPTITSATPGNGLALVAYSPPSSNGGASILNYTATCGGVSATGTTTPIVVTGLTNGTAVTCTIHATNSSGNGPESAPSVSITPAGPPDPPTIVSVTPGDRMISIAFTAPSNNGGAPIHSYTANCGGWFGSRPFSPLEVRNIPNGTTVTCTVYSSNGVGNGPESPPTAPVTPATVPGAPSITGVTAGNGSVAVAFTAPSDNGGAAINGYVATCGSASMSGTATPIVVSGLANGTAVTCTVRATNTMGNGAASSPSASVTPATVPGAPTITGVASGNGSVSVAFAAPSNNGGSAVTNYTATCGSASMSGTATPIVVTGLANGTAVTCTVYATNTVGSSASSAPSASVTPATVPGAPTLVSATRGSDATTVSLVFQAPADDGGDAIDTYSASCQPDNLLLGGLGSPLVVEGLDPDVAYECTVTAINGAGAGIASNTLTVPPRPTTDLAVTVSNGTGYVQGGSDVVYVVDVANLGANDVTGARVVDVPGATFQTPTWTCTGTGGATCPASGNGDIDILTNIPAGAGIRIELHAHVPTLPETTLSNTATVTTPPAWRDTNASNDTATDGPDIRGLFRATFE